MTAPARALACPRCGGPLVLLPGQRVVRCPWCSALDLVDSGPVVASFLARPRLARAEALSSMAASLVHPELCGGLERSARITPPRLFFVPFFELQARRAGRARIDRDVLVAPPPVTSGVLGVRGYDPAEPQPSRAPRVKRTEVDTKVVLSSWSFYWPAVELPGWGLGQIQPQRLRAGDGPPLERFDVVDADRTGTAFEPTVDAEAFRGAALKASPSRASDVKVIEERLTVLYYPLWRAAYQLGGRAFWVTLDGISGEVLRLSGPPSQKLAALRMLGAAAGLGLLGSILARIAFALGRGPFPQLAWAGWLATPLLLAGTMALARRCAHLLRGRTDTVLVRRGASLEPR